MQGGPIDSSKWSFQGLLACDFLRRCDSQLRVLYVFVIMEVGTRRIAHCNVTTHPSADAPAVSGDHHGRETVPGSSSTTATTFTPPNSIRPWSRWAWASWKRRSTRPRANAFCERLVWIYPPRVFGFPDSAERETPAENSQGVGGWLQPGPPTHLQGARDFTGTKGYFLASV